MFATLKGMAHLSGKTPRGRQIWPKFHLSCVSTRTLYLGNNSFKRFGLGAHLYRVLVDDVVNLICDSAKSH